MIIVVPLSTDAPVYHYPWMTIVVCILNVVIFFLTGQGYASHSELWMPWALQLGSGSINPIQWVTMNFIHFGYLHLLGNLFFIWGFGIVVEGKIGWWKYLLVYFAIGTAGGAIIQCVCSFVPGMNTPAAGASLILYGLMAISLVWAPKNEVKFFYMIFGFYIGVKDVTIMVFAAYYIAEQLFISFILLSLLGLGFAMFLLSQAGHLVGALLGFSIGVAMLKMKLVDCENWDLFAVMKGTHGNVDEYAKYRNMGYYALTATGEEQVKDSESNNVSSSKKKKGKKNLVPEMPIEGDYKYDPESYANKKDSREEKLYGKLKKYLTMGDVEAVSQIYLKLRQLDPKWQFNDSDMKEVIELLCEYEKWKDAIPFMEVYIKRSFDVNASMRIKLAAMLIEIYQRPRRALSILKPLRNEPLKKRQKLFFQRIVKLAKKQIQEGIIEFNEDVYDEN